VLIDDLLMDGAILSDHIDYYFDGIGLIVIVGFVFDGW
jgi:hypothetical protein